MPVYAYARDEQVSDSPLLRTRREAARLILWGYLIFATIGILLDGILLIFKWTADPEYQPTWTYVAFLLIPLLAAWISLRWLKHSLRRALVFFAWVGTITITLMIIYDNAFGVIHEPPLSLFAYHVGVFTLGLLLGFKAALKYAIVTSIFLIGFGLLYGYLALMVIPIILAFAMTLPSWLVDRLTQELQQSERKFEVMFQKSLDVILVVDEETGQVLRANAAAYEVLGYSPAILVDASFVSLFPSEEALAYADFLERLHKQGAFYRSQNCIRSDGSLCPMDLTATLVPWEDGEEAVLVTLRDVTERKRIDEELRRHREHLEELVQARTQELRARNEELDAFAHTVAHDIKSPLTMLVGFANLLEEQSDEVSRSRLSYYGEIIAQSGRKIDNIVEELLLLASVRQVDEVPLEPLDTARIIGEARDRLADLIAEYDAEIVVADSWPKAWGYPPWIEEVWVNYLSNAIKYGGRPPRVRLTARVQSDDTVCFCVCDNGPGLTPEQQARLFVPFTRLDRLRVEGHGLGLSIVRRILEKLGGEVGVESEVGQGTTFTFTLPKAS